MYPSQKQMSDLLDTFELGFVPLKRVISEPHRPLRALHILTHTHKGSIEINCYA